MPKNNIFVIRPYKFGNTWVFDDPATGLIKEAFVAGADTMIDVATAQFNVPDPKNGFVMLFSEQPFPGYQIVLKWRYADMGGNVYEWGAIEGWLCPALFEYFGKAPNKIYVKAEPRGTLNLMEALRERLRSLQNRNVNEAEIDFLSRLIES